jgi:hypothetical protein
MYKFRKAKTIYNLERREYTEGTLRDEYDYGGSSWSTAQ